MGLSDKRNMREGNVTMMHIKPADVNGVLYLWQSRDGLVHTSKHSQSTTYDGVLTLCGDYTNEMRYAGRQGFSTATVTCLACVVTP